MTSDPLDQRYVRQASMVTRKVANEVILVPIKRRLNEDAALFTLDGVAAFLWEKIDGHRTGHDLVQALQRVYNVDTVQAEQDVRSFLTHLAEIAAIQTDAPTGAPL